MAAGPALSSAQPTLTTQPGGEQPYPQAAAGGSGRLWLHLVQSLWTQACPQFSLHPHCLQPAQGWGPEGSVQGRGWSQRTASGTGKGTEEAE